MTPEQLAASFYIAYARGARTLREDRIRPNTPTRCAVFDAWTDARHGLAESAASHLATASHAPEASLALAREYAAAYRVAAARARRARDRLTR